MRPEGTHGSLNGRLYDYDTVDRDGLVGEELVVSLDGTVLFSTTTGADGIWSATVQATMDLERGEHELSVMFAGNASSP